MSFRPTQYLNIADAEAVKDWPVGTLVRLKPGLGVLDGSEDRPIARIASYIVGINGGVIVSPPLEDMRAWNIEALERA